MRLNKVNIKRYSLLNNLGFEIVALQSVQNINLLWVDHVINQ